MILKKRLLSLGFLFLLWGTPTYATFEDFTTYSTSGSAKYTVTASKILLSSFDKRETHCSWKDYGASNFGNFDHRYECKVSEPAQWGEGVCWSLSNLTPGTQTGCSDPIVTAGAGIIVKYIRWGSAPDDLRITLQNVDASSTDGTTGLAQTTLYYYTTVRTGSTITNKIYSDAIRTTLIDTQTVTHSSTAYRYVGAASSKDETVNSNNSTVYTENLEFIVAATQTTLQAMTLQGATIQ